MRRTNLVGLPAVGALAVGARRRVATARLGLGRLLGRLRLDGRLRDGAVRTNAQRAAEIWCVFFPENGNFSTIDKPRRQGGNGRRLAGQLLQHQMRRVSENWRDFLKIQHPHKCDACGSRGLVGAG